MIAICGGRVSKHSVYGWCSPRSQSDRPAHPSRRQALRRPARALASELGFHALMARCMVQFRTISMALCATSLLMGALCTLKRGFL